jgi:hypothetical protein
MWPTARSSVPEPEGVPAHVIFLRAPAACWWARAIVESTDTSQLIRLAASAKHCNAVTIWRHVPSRCHRRNSAYTADQDPYSTGTSRQGAPTRTQGPGKVAICPVPTTAALARSQLAGSSACGVARATRDQLGHLGTLPGPWARRRRIGPTQVKHGPTSVRRVSVVVESKTAQHCDLRCFRLPGNVATPACHPTTRRRQVDAD